MKNYVAIAVALAGVMLSAPAFAGSVGVTGGTKTYDKVIDHTYKHTTNVTVQGPDVVDNTIEKTVNNTTVKNVTVKGDDNITTEKKTENVTVNVYNNTAKVVGKDTAHSSSSSTKTKDLGQTNSLMSTSNSTVKNAINSLADAVRKDLTEQGRWGYTSQSGARYVGIGSDGSVKYYCNGSYGWDTYRLMLNSSLGKISRTETLASTKNTSSKSTDTKFTGTTSTKTSETTLDSSKRELTAHTKTNTTSTVSTRFDGATESLIGIEYKSSNNGILVGDTDNFSSAYAAQGDVSQTRHYDRDEYYTKTTTNVDHYTDTYTTTNNYTKTNTTTKVDNYTKTVTTTNTTTKTYNVLYQADLTGVTSPIVLDLDGDGKIEASNGKYLPHKGDFSKNVVTFDFYGNGFPMVMEWVGTNDGLLCRPNEDGTVTGVNLFGTANGYENGYDELSTLDTNRNGAVEGEELAGLMVWQDENHNGVADKGELKSLESLGITSIGVNHSNFRGSFVRDGKTYKTFDWWPSVIDGRKIGVAANK